MLFLFCVAVAIPATGAFAADPGDYVPAELIVCFDPGLFANEQEFNDISSQLHSHYNATVLENSSRLGIRGAQLVLLNDNVTVEEAVAWYEENSTVLFAEPDYIVVPPPLPQPGDFLADSSDEQEGSVRGMRMMALLYPNDPYYSEQWNLEKIELPAAWELTTGSDSVVIAVLDTGIDDSHPEFFGTIWTNPGEIAGNGIDDDGNGYIDDVQGWDFLQNDNTPRDDVGHGTEVASVVASLGNNGIGIAGVAWNVKVLPVRIGDASGFYGSNIVKGLVYADDLGADIIVCSFGGYDYSNLEQAAFERVEDPLIVCAAGNDGLNTDINPHYPSCFGNQNIISVAATDADDSLCYFSNYGRNSVDVGAPGSAVPALSLNSQYFHIDGTSMAAPHVAGLAGLVLSRKPAMSATEVRDLIMDNVDITRLNGYVRSSGRINAYNTVSAAVPDLFYTIVATAGEGGTIDPAGQVQVAAGESRTFYFIPESGYQVSDVLVDAQHFGPLASYTFSNVRGDHSIAVSFAPVITNYTMTATAGEGGAIDPAGQVRVAAGENIFYAIVPETGYQISDVLIDGVSAGAVSYYTFTDVRADHTIAAIFVPITAEQEEMWVLLAPGWNFISTPGPLAGGHEMAGVIFRDVNTSGHSLFTYSAESGDWASLKADDILEPYTAVWVYSSGQTYIVLALEPDCETHEVPLFPGWNAIGCPGASDVPARDALVSVADSWSQIIGFDAELQKYEVSLINGGSGIHSDANALAPAKGYWVFVRNPCVLR